MTLSIRDFERRQGSRKEHEEGPMPFRVSLPFSMLRDSTRDGGHEPEGIPIILARFLQISVDFTNNFVSGK